MLAHARRNLDRWIEGDAFGPGDLASLEEWRQILDEADVTRLIEIITDASDEGQRLRSPSPLVGAQWVLVHNQSLRIVSRIKESATLVKEA